MVIIAGYEKDLKDCFFAYNSGLESRFTWRFNTDDYTPSELNLIFQKKVESIEPEFYQNYDTKNPKRLLRALELFEQTGKKPSEFRSQKIKKRPFEIIKIGLKIDRDELYGRINKRVDIMIANGLFNEAQTLINFKHNNALKTVGYTEIFDFLNHHYSYEETIEEIKKNTRRFAKRQITWFNKDKDIKWFHPNQTSEIEGFILRS